MKSNRRYEFDYPSVTEIIGIIDKPGLKYWYGKFGITECEKKMRESQDIGHNVHKAIEFYLKDTPIPHKLSDQEARMYSMFVENIEADKIPKGETERVLCSHKHKYNGTADYIGPFVADWKTDSVPRNKSEERERVYKYKLQQAAYALAYEEETGNKIKEGRIYRVSKDFKDRRYKFKITKQLKQQFIGLREIFYEIRGK